LEGFQSFSFVGGEFFGYPDVDLDEKAAALAAFSAGEAFVFDFKDLAGECTGGDFEGGRFIGEEGNLEGGAQDEVGIADPGFIEEVFAFTGEVGMRFFFYVEEQVTRGAIPRAEVARPPPDEGGATFYAGRNVYLVGCFGFHEAGSTTARAGVGVMVSASLAGGTGLVDELLKEAAAHAVSHLSSSLAGRTNGRCFVSMACPPTSLAGNAALIGERFAGTFEHVFQRELEVDLYVLSLGAAWGAGPGVPFPTIRPSEKLLNNLRKRVGISGAGCIGRTYPTKAIILPALLGVAQDLVGFVDELEFFFGLGIIGVSVGVVFQG
jgi:hypothetical protein